jgi:hypothetical protein
MEIMFSQINNDSNLVFIAEVCLENEVKVLLEIQTVKL